MSEANNYNPNQVPLLESYTALPIEVLPERAQEVGNYFNQILDDYGKYTDLRIVGRTYKVRHQSGRQAEFTTGDTKLIVSKFDNPDFAPETVATIFELNKENKWSWDKEHTFTYNRKNKRQLDYRRGNILSYIPGEWPLENPGAEGMEDMLGSFLQEANQIIEKSRHPQQKVRAIGRRLVNFARKI